MFALLRKNRAKFKTILGWFLFLLLYTLLSLAIVRFSTACEQAVAAATSASFQDPFPVILIDPGHGGFDGGAVSADGIVEKDLNLAIASYLRDYLLLSGMPVVMTREKDVELVPEKPTSGTRKRKDILARLEMLERYDRAILVSIHQNKYPNSRFHGLQVFYSANDPDSERIAESIRDANRRLLDPENRREIKRAGKEILILDKATGPAVLIECGFLSNAAEAGRLCDPTYQKKLAFTVFTALCTYFESARR